MTGQTEIDFMAEALELAKKGLGHTRPNPPVGAVIVRDGKVIGRGWHKRCGGDHAEVCAMRDALRKLKVKSKSEEGRSVDVAPLSGCDLYVTLEPCSKAGRVGACTDAIIAAGIKRVVYAVPDPNPKNRGKAKRALAKYGIACERMDAKLDVVHECDDLLASFRKHVTTGLPYVTVKLAMSLDGKICDNWGEARWISCEESRKFTGRMRETVDAIMVGAETVRKDNPSLLSHGKPNKDLVRVVVSRSGKLPKDAQVFTDGKNPTLVYRDAVEAVRDLGKRGLMHVLCEGGLKLATSLAEAGLVDEWITVLAPKVIGTQRIGEAVAFDGEDAIVSYTSDEGVASPLLEGWN